MHLFLLAVGFGIVTSALLALAGVGVTLQFGVTNYVNFASGSYLSLGALLAWQLNTGLHIPFWWCVVLAGLGVSAVAVVVGALVFERFAQRRSAILLLVVTFAFWFVMSNVLLAIWGGNSRSYNVSDSNPYHLLGMALSRNQLLTILAAIVCLVGLHFVLQATKLGKQMRALSDDPDLAAVSGVNVSAVRLIAWAVSGFLIGIGGSLFALDLSQFATGFGDLILFVVFAAVVLGGIGQPYGAMLGALIVGLVSEVAAVYINPVYKNDIAFLVLILALLIRPQGLIPSRGRH
jgi:branched-subunit amino acid ABC-type transport system permease component